LESLSSLGSFSAWRRPPCARRRSRADAARQQFHCRPQRFGCTNALVGAQVALSLDARRHGIPVPAIARQRGAHGSGFKTANIEIASVDVSLSGYREQRAVELASRFREQLKAIPGVESL
jgi:hypothetical protein